MKEGISWQLLNPFFHYVITNKLNQENDFVCYLQPCLILNLTLRQAKIHLNCHLKAECFKLPIAILIFCSMPRGSRKKKVLFLVARPLRRFY